MLKCSYFLSLHRKVSILIRFNRFPHLRLRWCQDPSPGVEILLVADGKEDIKEGGDVDHQRHRPLQHGEQGDRLLLLLKYVHSVDNVLLVLGVDIFS